VVTIRKKDEIKLEIQIVFVLKEYCATRLLYGKRLGQCRDLTPFR